MRARPAGIGFVGIDSIVYAVEDMDLGCRFFGDWGLQNVTRTAGEARFRTLQGPSVVIRHRPGARSALVEVIWGVHSPRDLDAVAERLGKAERSLDGSLHGSDPFGYGIGFTLWQHNEAGTGTAKDGSTCMNYVGARKRISAQSVHYARATPARIGHVVFEVAGPEDLGKGEEFYVDRLGFRVSDRYTGHGLFCRCADESDHHNVAFLATRHQRTRFEHAAFEVRDIHEVFGGGLHFSERGWRTAIGPGRHKVSSAYFWYFENPCGGQVEYFSDADFLDKNWHPRNLPPSSDTMAEWALPDGIARFKGFPQP